MNLTIHTITIDFRNGYASFSSTSPGDLQNQIAAYCRENWANSFAAEDPLPSDRQTLIEYYFGNSEDVLQESTSTLALPESYASCQELFAALQEIADTPKQGEHGSSDRQSGQAHEPDIGAAIDQGTTARLHALIDKARAAIALASIPSVPRFTVFCQEAGGSGTIHIDTHEAADLEGAILVGKRQCITDWSSGYKDGESPWNMESVHCLGVAAGDVDILHWRDQPQ